LRIKEQETRLTLQEHDDDDDDDKLISKQWEANNENYYINTFETMM